MSIIKNLISKEEFRAIFLKRRIQFDRQSIKKGTESPYYEEGWELYKEFKTKTQIQKIKPIGRFFEDEVWCTFSKLGFDEMNKTSSFKISKKYTKEGERTKQIDVFMKDDDSVIVVECKATKEKGKKKYFSPIIEEISGMRSGIGQTIKEHYGNKNLSIGWVIATKNYNWTEDDKKFAKKKGVAVFTDVEIEYFNDLFKQVGTSAKYQLLAKVFPNKKIKSMSLEVPAIKYSNAKSKFYSFGIEPEKLLKLSYVAHRSSTMDSNVEQYQRMFKKDKLNEL